MNLIRKISQSFDKVKTKYYTKYLYYKKLKSLTPGKESIELSKAEVDSLEISVKVGCGMYCDYCPQDSYIKNFKENYQNQERILTPETFEKVFQNVPNSTLIKWTGFTEPMGIPEFPTFVESLAKKGYIQDISTTLSGAKESQIWFSKNVNLFNRITLHLPDNKKLMKCNVNELYLSVFRDTLEHSFSFGWDDSRMVLFLIGDDFHPQVKEIIDEFLKNGKLKPVQIHKAEVLNTRNSNIELNKLNLENVTMREFQRDQDGMKNNIQYYCSYRRLNQGVLLPNGKVALCCQDYNLDYIVGDLKTETLADLYKKIENDEGMFNDFKNGKFFPCTKCEHYVTTDNSFSGHLRK
ncbi:MAG: SPASM domain-containing protein [Leptospiraceae bacterium]|nr:SPASM domain-containing protein [Leptospiraceae bacterium]